MNSLFQVSSDLPMVWGNPNITIDPDNVIPYILHICPWKRGVFKGNETLNKILLPTMLGQIHNEKK